MVLCSPRPVHPELQFEPPHVISLEEVQLNFSVHVVVVLVVVVGVVVVLRLVVVVETLLVVVVGRFVVVVTFPVVVVVVAAKALWRNKTRLRHIAYWKIRRA